MYEMVTAYTPSNLHAWFTGLRNLPDASRFGGHIPSFGGSVLPHVYCYMLAALEAFQCSAFVETGTNTGKTVSVIGQFFNGPIYSCELDPHLAEIARANLMPFGFPATQVRLSLQDSVSFLDMLVREGSLGNRPFFFLDAHSLQGSWPLAAELSRIAPLPQWVAAIHDFPQPGHQQHPPDAVRFLNAAHVNEGLRGLAPTEWCYWFPHYPQMHFMPLDYRVGMVFVARGVNPSVAEELNHRMMPLLDQLSRLNGVLATGSSQVLEA